MAPEQAAGKTGALGPAVDVYALGAILYETVTGRPPFVAETALETIQEVCYREPLPPRRLLPGIAPDLEPICMKCLEKEPQRRYADAQALADDLGRFLVGKPIAARPVGVVGRGWRWCRRNPGVASLLALLALVVAAGVAGVTLKWQEAAAEAAAKEHARKEEQRQREEAQEHLYFLRIALAHRQWQANYLDQAERLLDACLPEHRHWEWHYLKRLCRPEPQVFPESNQFIYHVSFSPDGERLAWSTGTGGKVWQVATGRPLFVYQGRTFWQGNLPFNKEGTGLALPGGEVGSQRPCLLAQQMGTLRVWDATTGTSLLFLPGPPKGLTVLAYSLDGRRYATTDLKGPVKVWDTITGREVTTLAAGLEPAQRKGLLQGLNKAAFSPDGKWLALAGADTVRIWSVADGREVRTLKGARSFIWHVAFSLDGERLAAACDDGTGIVWNVASGAEVCILRGHTGPVRSLVFSPDGKLLVTGGADKLVKVWDAASGQEMYTLRGHTDPVLALAFTRDGKRLACGQLRSVCVWDLSTADQEVRILRGKPGRPPRSASAQAASTWLGEMRTGQ